MRFFFILSIFLYACSNDPEAVKEFIATENLPIEKIEGAEMLHTENGVLKVKIIATNIKRFEDIQPQLVFSNGLEVIFYNDSGSVKSVLKSENAEVDEINKIMTASQSVVLTSSTGKKLETEQLIWDENKNKIYTDKKVVITTDKEVVKGEGFISNPDFTEYSISKIQGTFNFETPAN
jgi:LPS export ABC transporter protein LptC